MQNSLFIGIYITYLFNYYYQFSNSQMYTAPENLFSNKFLGSKEKGAPIIKYLS